MTCAAAAAAYSAVCLLAFLVMETCQEDLSDPASSGSCAADRGECDTKAPGRHPLGYHWAQQKGDPARTGWSAYAVPFNLSAGPTWSWSDPHKDVIRATPLIDDEMNVYVCTVAGRVRKFKSDGTVAWTYLAEKKLPHSPSLHAGALYLTSADGRLLALDMKSGQPKWEVQVADRIGSDPSAILAHDGLLIFAAVLPNKTTYSAHGNTGVIAASAETGEIKWTFFTDNPLRNFQATTPGDGTVIFQDQTGAVYRLQLLDGHLVWRSGTREVWHITTGAAVAFEGRVFVVSNYLDSEFGRLHAYRLSDGQLLWSQALPHLAHQAVATGRLAGSRDRLSVVVGTGKKPKVDITGIGSGTLASLFGSIAPRLLQILRWSLMLSYPGWYAAEAEASAVLAFDAESGELQWRYDLAPWDKPAADGDIDMIRERTWDIRSGANPHNDPSCAPNLVSQPVVDGSGSAFIAFQDGRIYAIRDENSDGMIDVNMEVSSVYLRAAHQGPPALAPGMLVAASCAGSLHAFKL